MKIIDENNVLIPAGSYYLGDPCYSFENHDNWMTLLRSCNFFQGNPIGTIDGNKILAFPTAYGDGVFYDKESHEYWVDAGMIGLVPVNAAEKAPEGLCQKITFTEETKCSNRGGEMKFGKVNINTKE